MPNGLFSACLYHQNKPNSNALRNLKYFLVDVFTDHIFCGNQLAVFPDAAGLKKNTMQSIARELNLSETTFVFSPTNTKANFRVRIFTPGEELPMAGHPTLGTAFMLSKLKRFSTPTSAKGNTIANIVFQEKVGLIPVTIVYDRQGNPDRIVMQQPKPVFGLECREIDELSQMLSLDKNAILDTGLPAQVVSCGVPFLFVPIRDLSSIRKIRFRRDVSEKLLPRFKTSNVFVFAREVESKSSFVHSRMFAPGIGVAEDPATGSASGPLGCYLVKHGVLKATPEVEFVSEQGIEISRPSLINVRIGVDSRGQIEKVLVSGQCVQVGEGLLQLK